MSLVLACNILKELVLQRKLFNELDDLKYLSVLSQVGAVWYWLAEHLAASVGMSGWHWDEMIPT